MTGLVPTIVSDRSYLVMGPTLPGGQPDVNLFLEKMLRGLKR